MTNDGVKKMLRRSGGFDARRKIRIDMISKSNMKLLLACAVKSGLNGFHKKKYKKAKYKYN